MLAEGVAGLTASHALRSSYRSHAWVWPLEPGRPRLWEIDELAARVDRARSDLKGTAFAFDVTAPIEELRAAERASTVAGRRLLLVGGEAAALLFAFAVLAAAALRRDLGGARSRLRLAGARRWQVALLTGTESAAVAAGGVALGWLAGLGVAAFAADRSGAPVIEVLRESVLSGRGLLVALAVAAAATPVLAAAVSGTAPRRGRFGALDLLALAAVAVVVLAVAQGATDAARLGEGGGALLLLLPGLLSFAAAVAAARLLAPALRLLARAARRRLDVRLATLSLARGPGTATIAAAFLVVSVSLAALAEGYRATLERGERDAAAAQVPLDFAVREDLRRLVPVQEAASLERFRALGDDVGVVPVFRASGGAGRIEGLSGITLLGLPAASVSQLRGFDGGERLAARIDPGRQLAPEGPRVAHELRLTAAGDAVRLEATVLTPTGAARSVSLGVVGRRPAVLRAELPRSARGGRLLAIDLVPDTRLQERGADAGTAQLVRVRLQGEELDGWLGEGGARVSRIEGGVLVEARLTPQRVSRVRAPQPTDSSRPRVLATPLLAAAAGGSGLLPLQVGGTEVAVEVVGTVPRIPGTRGEAVAADVGELVTALNAARPGAARVNEVWLSVPDDERAAEVEAALAEPPFRPLTTVSRRALETDSSRDPLAHGTLLALLAAALVALALAVAGLTLTVLADLRDERGELLDLEAEGASPGLLRRVVRLRALVVALFGIAGGAVTGAVLATLVTDVVAVTARAREPEPPLVLTLDPVVMAAAALCYAALASLLVLAATRRAFSARTAL